MQRLLQGDVGSGKTVVAALAALQAVEAAIRWRSWRRPKYWPSSTIASSRSGSTACRFRSPGSRVDCRRKEARGRSPRLQSGDAQIAVGTHALFQEEVTLPKLGSGDRRRAASLRRRAAAGAARQGGMRRRASVDDERDADSAHAGDELLRRSGCVGHRRDAARTHAGRRRNWCARRAAREVVERVREPAAAGRQAYWVCPLIEESEKLELQTAVALHAELTTTFPELTRGLAARTHEAARESRGDGRPSSPARCSAGRNDGDRSRRRRAQRVADGDRTRRALRARAIAPAARPRRARRGREPVHPAVRGPDVGDWPRPGSRLSSRTATASKLPARIC